MRFLSKDKTVYIWKANIFERIKFLLTGKLFIVMFYDSHKAMVNNPYEYHD